jgi:membrane-bound ClpP family serine protease
MNIRLMLGLAERPIYAGENEPFGTVIDRPRKILSAEDIPPGHVGRVYCEGTTWRAINRGVKTIRRGDAVVFMSRVGVTFWVAKDVRKSCQKEVNDGVFC